MDGITAIIILALLSFGPLAVHRIEQNIEIYFLTLGLIATTLGGGWSIELVEDAVREPFPISIAVLVSGILFSYTREPLDRGFSRLRVRTPRPVLAAAAIFLLGVVSSVITAIVAAVVLVEVIGLLRLSERARVGVAVAGCYGIGLGASLTPLGEPLSTLAASALKLPFLGLFELLATFVVPGVAASALLAGFFARGEYGPPPDGPHVRESPLTALSQSARVFVFVAGLVMISHALGPLTVHYVNLLTDHQLFWANTVSAALDNATLVALEVHDMSLVRARGAILSLLVSGGMLIPGNIPNIVSAGALRIGSAAWARVAVPIGIAMLGIYFAVLYTVD
ncbi:MAG: DUF1646 family protein [Candidatus Binataceae bacterium]